MQTVYAPPTKVRQWHDGKASYLIAGVTPSVPFTTKGFKELTKQWERKCQVFLKDYEKLKPKIVEVASKSDPNKKYKVTIFNKNQVVCECKGYQFRRNCSHVEQIKKGLK